MVAQHAHPGVRPRGRPDPYLVVVVLRFVRPEQMTSPDTIRTLSPHCEGPGLQLGPPTSSPSCGRMHMQSDVPKRLIARWRRGIIIISSFILLWRPWRVAAMLTLAVIWKGVKGVS